MRNVFGCDAQILSRPLPPPAIEQGQFKTMSLHGGTGLESHYNQPDSYKTSELVAYADCCMRPKE